jgi:hypothetical protein
LALGGDGGALGELEPAKPKWMRWKTYDRKVSQWRNAEAAADGLFYERAAALWRRLK